MKIIEIEGHPLIPELLDIISLIFDCGACIGDFTNQLYNLCKCHYNLYEPDPRNYRKIRNRFRGNSDIISFNIGIDKEIGIKPFHLGKYITASSFFDSHRGLGDTSVDIQVTTLGEEISVFGNVDLLKLDLEGSEIDVIPTLDVITLSKIKQITVEFHLQSKIDGYTKEKVDVCRDYLKNWFDEILYVDKGNDGHHGLYLNKSYGYKEKVTKESGNLDNN